MTNTKHKRKFNLALCELHCAKLHGGKESGHYLIIEKIKDTSFVTYFNDTNSEEEDEDDEEEESNIYMMYDLIEFYTDNYKNVSLSHTKNPHRIIRNYLDIIASETYIKPEIVQRVKLGTGEYAAILKTFWLKIIQRTWKKVFASRNKMMEMRKSLHHLRYRSIHGGWSSECRNIPTIVGMLRV
jgi:hypothetical protein